MTKQGADHTDVSGLFNFHPVFSGRTMRTITFALSICTPTLHLNCLTNSLTFTMFRHNAKNNRADTSAELFGIVNEIQIKTAIMAITRSTGIDDRYKSIFKPYLNINVRRKNNIGKIKAMRPQSF